ncbi:MAG: YfjI family protein [Acidobacteriota bacterium]
MKFNQAAERIIEEISKQDSEAWPDPVPLPEEFVKVPELPADWLPSSLRAWLVDSAERMGVPLCFPAVAAIVGLSAAVGRRACITPLEHDASWRVVPNLWGAIIGRPGLMKTPAARLGLEPLCHLEKLAQERNKGEQSRYRSDLDKFRIRRDAWKQVSTRGARAGKEIPDFSETEPEQPAEVRFVTNDGTGAKIHELLSHNPGGLLIFRDELTGWLATLDQPGREGERAFFLESNDGNSAFSLDRIGRGSLYVDGLCLSIFGGIQPARLQAYLSDGLVGGPKDDGLLQRFQLLVWPENPAEVRIVDRPADDKAKQEAVQVFEKISCLQVPFGIEARFDSQAQELFREWRWELEHRLVKRDMPESLESHLAKYRSLMPSLALLFRLADWAADQKGDPHTVSLAYARLAAAWCTWLETHAAKVYSSLRQGGHLATRALAAKIMSQEVATVFAGRDVYLKGWRYLDSREAVRKAAETLADLSWLRIEFNRDTGGAPSTRYHVNPKIWERTT